MLVIHLKQYFGAHSDCLKYNDFLLPSIAKRKTRKRSLASGDSSEFHYCEYYYSCRSYPCVDAKNKFQKSHDFELKLPIDNGTPHLVQIRQPVGLLISWYELRLKKGRETDSEKGWATFVERNIDYVDGFLRKWVPVGEKNGLIIDYDDYLRQPEFWLTRAVQLFLGSTADIKTRRIKNTIKDVRPSKDNSRFRYYQATPEITTIEV